MLNDNWHFRNRGSRLSAAALVVLALATGGCTARVDTMHPVAADEVYVNDAPYVAAAPRAVYRGQTVYYVSGHWYRPQGRGWAYYRNEPPELARQRPYVQAAPPAYRDHDNSRGAYGGGPRPGNPPSPGRPGAHEGSGRPAHPGRAPDAVRVQ